MTIDALGKSDGIQSLKINNLHGHLLFDSSEDPALLAGVDDTDDKDTSLAGVPVANTTIVTNDDDDSDAESNHNSSDPNEAITTPLSPMRGQQHFQQSIHTQHQQPHTSSQYN